MYKVVCCCVINIYSNIFEGELSEGIGLSYLWMFRIRVDEGWDVLFYLVIFFFKIVVFNLLYMCFGG